MKTAVEYPTAHPGIPDWIEWGKERLGFLAPEAARGECERMLEALLGVSRAELYLSGQAAPGVFFRFHRMIEARKTRLPLAYLLGEAPFWEDRFQVDPGVLIPRPETEGIIENFLREGGFSAGDSFRFLDLGTGSGAIAITIARLFPNAAGAASDISGRALEAASRNAKKGDRLLFSNGAKKSSLSPFSLQWIQMDGLLGFKKESFDVIFSNPPYVSSKEWESLEPEVKCEPRLALDGGEDGLDFYRRLSRESGALKRGGSLWVEAGFGQACEVKSLLSEAGFEEVRTFKDFNQIERIIAGLNFAPHPDPLPIRQTTSGGSVLRRRGERGKRGRTKSFPSPPEGERVG